MLQHARLNSGTNLGILLLSSELLSQLGRIQHVLLGLLFRLSGLCSSLVGLTLRALKICLRGWGLVTKLHIDTEEGHRICKWCCSQRQE
jgi:hypothetical protein